MFAEITGQAVLGQGDGMFERWLIPLQTFLEQRFGVESTKTKRSVQFRFRGIIDVDLLVSPFWGQKDPAPFYQFLQRIHPSERDR